MVCSPNIPIKPYFVLSPECQLAAKKWKPQTSSRTRSQPAYKTRFPVSTNEATAPALTTRAYRRSSMRDGPTQTLQAFDHRPARLALRELARFFR